MPSEGAKDGARREPHAADAAADGTSLLSVVGKSVGFLANTTLQVVKDLPMLKDRVDVSMTVMTRWSARYGLGPQPVDRVLRGTENVLLFVEGKPRWHKLFEGISDPESLVVLRGGGDVPRIDSRLRVLQWVFFGLLIAYVARRMSADGEKRDESHHESHKELFERLDEITNLALWASVYSGTKAESLIADILAGAPARYSLLGPERLGLLTKVANVAQWAETSLQGVGVLSDLFQGGDEADSGNAGRALLYLGSATAGAIAMLPGTPVLPLVAISLLCKAFVATSRTRAEEQCAALLRDSEFGVAGAGAVRKALRVYEADSARWEKEYLRLDTRPLKPAVGLVGLHNLLNSLRWEVRRCRLVFLPGIYPPLGVTVRLRPRPEGTAFARAELTSSVPRTPPRVMIEARSWPIDGQSLRVRCALRTPGGPPAAQRLAVRAHLAACLIADEDPVVVRVRDSSKRPVVLLLATPGADFHVAFDLEVKHDEPVCIVFGPHRRSLSPSTKSTVGKPNPPRSEELYLRLVPPNGRDAGRETWCWAESIPENVLRNGDDGVTFEE